MFEFQMEMKDAENCNNKKMEEFKISEVPDRRFHNPKFKVDGFCPKNMDEALEYIHQIFYFAPMYVWIDGVKLDPWKVKNKYCKSGKI